MQTFNNWDFSWAFTSPKSWVKFVCATSRFARETIGIEFSASSSLLLKIFTLWENMPRSDFSWPSANSNKLFRELEQLHWGNVKNISWHTLTSSTDRSSLCENKDLSVSHLYSLWFFSSSASLRHFYFIFLSAESRASKYRCCGSPSASDQAALGCWERTSWWHGQVGEQGGWTAVVRQKIEAVLRKRSNFKINLSLLVIQADGVAHLGTTDKMALIAKQREVLGFHSFLWKTRTVLWQILHMAPNCQSAISKFSQLLPANSILFFSSD